MKKLIPFLLLFAAGSSSAQTFGHLDANNVYARINIIEPLFRNGAGPGFEFPAGSGAHSIFSATFAIAANNSGNIHAAFDTEEDFLPGPLQDGTALPSTHTATWNRVWKINASEISYHQLHYNDVGYVVPASIAEWPAHGNAAYNEPANIAPFFDANGNELYEPSLGEYPLIKGTQAIFFVQNDMGAASADYMALGLEIQCMAYVFDCTGDAALDNTVFVNYRFINRSSTTYTDAYVGMYTDTDLGNYDDDYTGCNVEQGVAFAYNGDAYDENYAESNGYGANLAVQGLVFLAGPLQDADGNDNPVIADLALAQAANGIVYEALGTGYGDGTADNERLGIRRFLGYSGTGGAIPGLSDPDNGHQLYNLLGAQDYNFGGVTSDFMFPGTSDPLFFSTNGVTISDWTETSGGFTPGDRRSICSTGPFTIAPGETNELDMAYTAAQDNTTSGVPLAALSEMLVRAGTVRNYFNNNSAPCGDFYNGIDKAGSTTSLTVYPNPTGELLFIELSTRGTQTCVVYDAYGKKLMQTNLTGLTRMDVSGLEAGVYFISGPGIQTRKFMVQH